MRSNILNQCPCPRCAPIQQRQPQLKPASTEARQKPPLRQVPLPPTLCVSNVTATPLSVTLRSFAKAEGQWVWWDPSEEPLCSHEQGPTLSSGQAGAVRDTAHALSFLVTKPYEAQLVESPFPFPVKIHWYFAKTNKKPQTLFYVRMKSGHF